MWPWSILNRNKRLDAWARSVPLSESQQGAMWEIWQAFKAGRIPQNDPLADLSEEDREYVKLICSPEVRPAEFGLAETLRVAQFMSLIERDYKAEHAAIIVGMTINRVGRKDI